MKKLTPEEARQRKERLYADLESGKLSIGEACRRIRQSIGLTREEYARRVAKISPETLKAIETGNGNPRLETLEKIINPFRLEIRFVRKPSPTEQGRLIAIGDIHGHRDALERLLQEISPTATDQLVFLGDYIDRGPDSRGVIELLLEVERQFPQTIYIRGNHEQMFLDALVENGTIHIAGHQRLRYISRVFSRDAELDDSSIFLNNGGGATLKSYNATLDGPIDHKHISFLANTKLFWRSGQFLFVHAGSYPSRPPEEMGDPYVLLWERYAPPGEDGETHVVGHHPTHNGKPLLRPGRYSLDTGAAYGRMLTACNVRTKHFWQVPVS